MAEQGMNIPGRGPVELSNVSQSYGGTLYGTTPGGTRIIYTKDMLLKCANSPLAKSPPCNMPEIPGVTKGVPGRKEEDDDPAEENNAEEEREEDQEEEDLPFEMDRD
eukprot:NODE_2021_length_557_cov_1253.610236_g1476_i2.p1 GENE.NODE_2021_length_557_cov_1253.610236_g1476_i2~~NODE_2021_length_557_cov_1253.610236_g1476_i2.p1  ORF type:complete len:107 (-),score=26.58 NODE_2021_length_557_cov_1253.610236_g1476_i2:161-481(-)